MGPWVLRKISIPNDTPDFHLVCTPWTDLWGWSGLCLHQKTGRKSRDWADYFFIKHGKYSDHSTSAKCHLCLHQHREPHCFWDLRALWGYENASSLVSRASKSFPSNSSPGKRMKSNLAYDRRKKKKKYPSSDHLKELEALTFTV